MSNPQLNTPILFIIFNRPNTAQEVFNSIKAVKPKKLYVASDGPRSTHPKDFELCQKSKDILKQIDWDCELHTHFHEKNFGCNYTLIHEISWFFENEERGIILEDDVVPNNDFFFFSEELLKKYQDNLKVMMISGFNPISAHHIDINTPYDYYFSRFASIWGWATWRNRWNKLVTDYPNIEKMLDHWFKDTYFKKTHAFQEYFGRQYENSSKCPKRSSWDLQWCYSLEINNGLCIVPAVNLISNIGQFGFHSNDIKKRDPLLNLPTKHIDVPKIRHPTIIDRCAKYDELRFNQTISAMKFEKGISTCGHYMRKIGLSRIYYSLINSARIVYHRIKK